MLASLAVELFLKQEDWASESDQYLAIQTQN